MAGSPPGAGASRRRHSVVPRGHSPNEAQHIETVGVEEWDPLARSQSPLLDNVSGDANIEVRPGDRVALHVHHDRHMRGDITIKSFDERDYAVRIRASHPGQFRCEGSAVCILRFDEERTFRVVSGRSSLAVNGIFGRCTYFLIEAVKIDPTAPQPADLMDYFRDSRIQSSMSSTDSTTRGVIMGIAGLRERLAFRQLVVATLSKDVQESEKGILDVQPRESLEFTHLADGIAGSLVTVTNNCAWSMAYRVKSTHPGMMAVSPALGFLESGDTVTIHVELCGRPPQHGDVSHFMVLGWKTDAPVDWNTLKSRRPTTRHMLWSRGDDIRTLYGDQNRPAVAGTRERFGNMASATGGQEPDVGASPPPLPSRNTAGTSSLESRRPSMDSRRPSISDSRRSSVSESRRNSLEGRRQSMSPEAIAAAAVAAFDARRRQDEEADGDNSTIDDTTDHGEETKAIVDEMLRNLGDRGATRNRKHMYDVVTAMSDARRTRRNSRVATLSGVGTPASSTPGSSRPSSPSRISSGQSPPDTPLASALPGRGRIPSLDINAPSASHSASRSPSPTLERFRNMRLSPIPQAPSTNLTTSQGASLINPNPLSPIPVSKSSSFASISSSAVHPQDSTESVPSFTFRQKLKKQNSRPRYMSPL